MDITSPFPQPPATDFDDPARPSPQSELNTFVSFGRFITAAAVRIVGAAFVLSAILTLCLGLSAASLPEDLLDAASRSKAVGSISAESRSAITNQISAHLLRTAVLSALVTAAMGGLLIAIAPAIARLAWRRIELEADFTPPDNADLHAQPLEPDFALRS